MNNNDFYIRNNSLQTDNSNKGKKKIVPVLILVLLVGVAGFLVYELKFKKDDTKKSDKYVEYDPNYKLEDGESRKELDSNGSDGLIDVEHPEESNSITENTTSNKAPDNILSNILSNVNKTSNSNVVSNSNIINNKSNMTSNANSNISNVTSNANSNKGKDTEKPVIKSANITTTDNSIIIIPNCSDNVTKTENLTIRYSLTGGLSWQSTNTFYGLAQNARYRVLVQVTDEAGNKVEQEYTAFTKRSNVRTNVNGIYIREGNRIYVYQLNSNEIAYKSGTNGSWKYLALSSYNQYEKHFGSSVYFDYKYLYFYGLKYTYDSWFNSSDQIFEDLYGKNKKFYRTTVCNGVYTNGKYSLSFVAYKDSYNNVNCMLYAKVAAGEEWIQAGDKIHSSTKITFGEGSQAGTFWSTTCEISGKKMTVTNPNGIDKTYIGGKTAGTYTYSKAISINDAIKLKLVGKK